MFRILIVCTANICRSPMGEAILQDLVTQESLDEVIEVSSAGLLGIEGEKASEFSIAVAKENGLDLGSHRSKGIPSKLMEESDLVLTMTVDHTEKLKIIHSKHEHKIYPLKQYLTEEKRFSYSIEDPIGLSLDFYRKVFNEIRQELERILPELKNLAQN